MTDIKNLSILDIGLLLLGFSLIALALYYPPASLLVSKQFKGNLMTTLHQDHNAYFHLTSLGAWAASRVGANVLILIAALGLSSALYYHKVIPIVSVCSAALVLSINTALYGDDLCVLGPLATLPWLYLVICSANSSKQSYLVLLCTLAFGLWLLLYALSIPILLLAALVHILINRESLNRPILTVLFLCLAVLFVLTSMSPELPWPDYPIDARVVSMIDAPPGLTRPLVGIDLPFHTIERPALLENYGSQILPLAVLLLLVGLTMSTTLMAQRAYIASVFGFALAYLDMKLPEHLAQIAPLRAFARLFPELSLIPLSPTILSLSLSTIILLFVLSGRSARVKLILSLMLSCLAISFSIPDRLSNGFNNTNSAWSATPSNFVAKFFDPNSLDLAQQPQRTIKPKATEIIVTTSLGVMSDASLLFDRDDKTRWTSGLGKQKGDEWLSLSFLKPQKLLGLKLLTGGYPTDFPRGLRIKAGDNCNSDSLKTTIDYPVWQGSLKFSKQGYPYFSAQSEVIIQFPKEIETSCLRIEQIAVSDHFDWSIAELRLIQTKGEGQEEELSD